MDIDDVEEQEPLMEDLQPDLQLESEIDAYKKSIDQFKYNMYVAMIQKDKNHSADSLGPMYGYHGLYMQCIGTLISIFDSQNPKPVDLQNESLQKEFQNLINNTLYFKQKSRDAQTLAYSVLLTKSTEHPYIFPINMK